MDRTAWRNGRRRGATKDLVATSVLNAVAMQIVAVGIEPGLGALDMTADPCDHPPEPPRMIHFDEMRHLMGAR